MKHSFLRFLLLLPLFLSAGSAGQKLSSPVRLRLELAVTPETKQLSRLQLRDSDRVFSAFLEVAGNTRTSVRLYDDFQKRRVGFDLSFLPEVLDPSRIRLDSSIRLLLPENGVFHAEAVPGSDDGGSFSGARILKTGKPFPLGPCRMRSGRIMLPMAVTAFPPISASIPVRLKGASVEVRILSVRSGDLLKTGGTDMQDAYPAEDALLRIASLPADFSCSFTAMSSSAGIRKPFPGDGTAEKTGAGAKGRFGREKPGFRISLTEVASGIIRADLGWVRPAGVRPDRIPVLEHLELEGFLSLRSGKWSLPVRLRPWSSGTKSSFEEKFNREQTMERLILIRITNSSGKRR